MCDSIKADSSAKDKPNTPCDSSKQTCPYATPPPTCTLTSETVATSPLDRTRVKIGVGEEITLTYSPSSATWSKTGTGTLSATAGATIIFTAGEVAESVTITTVGAGGSINIMFTVIEPSSWIMKRTTGTNLRHKHNVPGCGWRGTKYIHPIDVNFYRVETREKDSQYVGTGSSTHDNGVYHGSYPPPDHASAWFILTKHTVTDGCTDNSVDSIDTADYAAAVFGAAPPFKAGSGYFPITFQWRVIGSASIKNFSVSNQTDEITPSGRVNSGKGGNNEHTMWNDPSSSI